MADKSPIEKIAERAREIQKETGSNRSTAHREAVREAQNRLYEDTPKDK